MYSVAFTKTLHLQADQDNSIPVLMHAQELTRRDTPTEFQV